VSESEMKVDESSKVLVSVLLGGVLGGLCGFLYLTEDGRKFRDRIEPFFDEFGDDMKSLSRKVKKARQAAQEGLDAFLDVTEQMGAERKRWASSSEPNVQH
jgi:gas vesicle protein